jgi:phenylacetic acid degradation operon negative regulatory protein
MGGARQDIEAHIARLHSGGRLRVWSLLVTFFGDAVAPRGGRVALSVLQDAMALLNIEAGAVRTAMSRLAGDGWVEREREGRLSFYELVTERPVCLRRGDAADLRARPAGLVR